MRNKGLEEKVSIDSGNSKYVHLNKPDSRLLESNGKYFISHGPSSSIIPIDEMLAKTIINGKISHSDDTLKIDQLLSFGVISLSDQDLPNSIIECSKPPIKTLIFHVMDECNLKCRHCYNQSDPSKEDRLNSNIICETLTSFANMGGLITDITGGEPLLREDIFDILHTAKNNGLHTHLLSNGTNISVDLVEKIKKNVHKIVISIDGLGEVHDWIRGEGVFNDVEKSMNYLNEANVGLGATTMLTYKNLNQLEDIQRFLIGKNVTYWNLVLPRNSGRFKQNDISVRTCDEWFSNIDRYYKVLSNLKQRAKDNNMEVIIDHVMIPYHDRREIRIDPESLNYSLYNKGRVCWDNTITVLANGDVKGCLFIDGFVYGNLKNTDFRTIFSSQARKDTIENFREFKGDKECPIIPIPYYT